MLRFVHKRRRGAIRLVSAVVALALVFAHVVGGYAHAAGHNHANGHVSCAHEDISTNAAASSAISVEDDGEHCTEPADNHTDTFDFMCNGGLAILVTPLPGYLDTKPPHSSAVPKITHLLLPASLERPPKSAVRA